VQEGLTNVAKYARATQVSVRLVDDASMAALSIQDNGAGFDTARVPQIARGTLRRHVASRCRHHHRGAPAADRGTRRCACIDSHLALGALSALSDTTKRPAPIARRRATAYRAVIRHCRRKR